MKTDKQPKPKRPKASITTAPQKNTPDIEIIEMTQGLVKKTREVHSVNEITGEMILDIFQRASSPARLERLRARVQQHSANELHDHHVDELKRIKRHFAAGTDEAVLKLMLASLELKMNLADTDQYVKPVKANEETRAAQAARASLPRPKWLTEDENLADIVRRIAAAPSRMDESALDLWPLLFSELDRLGMDPSEKYDPSRDERKNSYEYTLRDGKRTKLKFGSFQEMVTKARKSD